MTIRISRRFLIGTATAIALTLGVARPASAEEAASVFVHRLGDRLIAIVNSGMSPVEKKQAILPILQSDVDVDAIARYCLGRYWRVATPAERTEYLGLFHQVLVNAISDRLGDYRGVSFTIGDTSTTESGDKSVNAILHRPQQADANMQWIVSTASGSPKIVDVFGEGASLRLTQRQDYASYIQQNGGQVANLLTALKHQIARHQAAKGN